MQAPSPSFLILLLFTLVATCPMVARAQVTLEAPTDTVFHQALDWSPDGRDLVFSEFSEARDGAYAPDKMTLFIISPDRAPRRKLADSGIFLSWSSDGQQIVFSSWSAGKNSIHGIQTDGTGRRILSDGIYDDSAPSLSPTTDQVVYSSERDGHRKLYVARLGTAGRMTEARQLTSGPGEDYNPVFSVDGSRIVFYRELGDARDQIHVIASDGTGEERITDGTLHNIYPSFTPSDDVLFIQIGEDNQRTLALLDPVSKTYRPTPIQGATFARVSPDGTKVAFIAGRWPKTAIYLSNLDGSEVKKIVN